MEINKTLQCFLSLNKLFDSESSFQSLVLTLGYIPRAQNHFMRILGFGYIKAYIN